MATVTATNSIDNFDGVSNTGTGADTIKAANGTANAGDIWNGGGGIDTLVLTSKFASIDLSAVQISNIENLSSGSQSDHVTMSFAEWGVFSSIDLGHGNDSLTIAVSGIVDASAENLATLKGVEVVNLSGSSAADSITLTGSELDRFTRVSLGTGSDALNITSTSAHLNSFSDANLSGVDIISASTASQSVTISLGLQTEALAIGGSNFADTLIGGAGNDTLIGGAGADHLDGGLGNNVLSYSTSAYGVIVNLATGTASGGDATGDTFLNFENVIGSAASDRLTGDAGDNLLSGGRGADVLIGGAGADTLDGGAGMDTVSYLASGAGVSIDIANHIATGGDAQGDVLVSIERFLGSNFADSINGDARANAIGGNGGDDTLSGAGGNDFLAGNGGADAINGDDGNDTLNGGIGNDTLNGGIGNDRIISGAGKDLLTGGDGSDTFVFQAVNSIGRGTNGDTITDFTTGIDKIDLSLIDANSTVSGNQAFSFIGGAVFSHHAGELRFVAATGVLQGDVNGDGVADFTLHLTNGASLAIADLIL